MTQKIHFSPISQVNPGTLIGTHTMGTFRPGMPTSMALYSPPVGPMTMGECNSNNSSAIPQMLSSDFDLLSLTGASKPPPSLPVIKVPANNDLFGFPEPDPSTPKHAPPPPPSHPSSDPFGFPAPGAFMSPPSSDPFGFVTSPSGTVKDPFDSSSTLSTDPFGSDQFRGSDPFSTSVLAAPRPNHPPPPKSEPPAIPTFDSSKTPASQRPAVVVPSSALSSTPFSIGKIWTLYPFSILFKSFSCSSRNFLQ